MHKLVLIFSVFLMISCNSKEVYNTFKPIDKNEWNSKNKIKFIVKNIDTISSKNVFINIRNNKNYEFSSIFLIAKINFPNGLKVIDTLEYEMADATGNWLGTGFTDVKENKFFYKESVVFNKSGNYNFTIENATRGINDIEGKKPLKGIIDVGISIEKEE